MTKNLIIRSYAEQEISDITSWYEERLTGLGKRFLENIDSTLKSILENPLVYHKVYKNYRRALLGKFPYGVYYFIEENNIFVFAVYHEKRDPDFWKK